VGRLPDAVVLTGGAVGVATAVVATVQHGPSAAGAAAAGCAAFCVPILVAHLASPDAMGFGDVKLGAVLGVAAGLLGWRWAVLALAVASGITVIVAAATRRRAVPFGPGLVAGAATSIVLAWCSSVTDGGPLGWEVATWR
jgi:leader peptidase (prepilin peptidase) / N-methyltransferase